MVLYKSITEVNTWFFYGELTELIKEVVGRQSSYTDIYAFEVERLNIPLYPKSVKVVSSFDTMHRIIRLREGKYLLIINFEDMPINKKSRVPFLLRGHDSFDQIIRVGIDEWWCHLPYYERRCKKHLDRLEHYK